MAQLTLKAVRVNAGKTLEEASKDLKMSKATLSNYENGKRTPNIERVKKILAYYNVSFDDILFI